MTGQARQVMKNESKIYGVLGSLLFMLLLFLLLWFVYVDRPWQPEDEGIMVSFGDFDTGGGQETEQPATLPTQTVAPPPKTADPSENDLLTQEDEQTLALQKQRKEEERRKKAEEAERIRKQKEEQARIEAEQIAKEKAIAEQKAKEQAAIDKANQLGSLFGNSGNNSGGNGSDNSATTKGNPLGSGSSGGNSWSLKGRNLNGKLASPSYNSNDEGVVVVEIRVNAAGKVIDARAAAGTNISDKQTQRAAETAARKATFSEGDNDVIGTITYVFKLK